MYLYVYFYVLLLLLYFCTKEQHSNISTNQNTRQSVALNLLMKGHSFSPFLQSWFSLIFFFCYLTLSKVLALPLADTCQLFWNVSHFWAAIFRGKRVIAQSIKGKMNYLILLIFHIFSLSSSFLNPNLKNIHKHENHGCET